MGGLTYNSGRNEDGTPKADYALSKFSDTPEVIRNLYVELCGKFNVQAPQTKDALMENLNVLRYMSGLNKTEFEIGLAKEHPLVSVNDEEFKKFKDIVVNLSTHTEEAIEKMK